MPDFSLLFAAVPTPLLVVMPDNPVFTIVAATGAFAGMTGVSREDIAGRGLAIVFPETGLPELRTALRCAIATRCPQQLSMERQCSAAITPVIGVDGNISCLLVSIEEEAPRNQARQRLLLDLLRGQRKTSDPAVMMQAAAEAVGRFLDVDRVGFFEIRNGFLDFSVGWTAGRLPLLTPGKFPPEGIGAAYLEQVRAGRTLGISDARTDPLTRGSLFPQIGTVALVGVPIIRNGNWQAGFYVNHSEIRYWSEEEIALVRDVGEQTWDAIERARAESALRKSEERLNFALDAGGAVGTWDWDIPRDRMYCNARFAKLFSVEPERAAAGAPLSAFADNIHPDDRARVEESVRHAVQAGEDFAEEYRVTQPDGSARWVYARGRCHLDDAGQPLRFPGVVFEITDRKHAEAHLHQQWHTFDTALSNTPDFTYIFDLDGRFTYVNRALLSLWQRSLEESIGKNFFDLGYPFELAERLQKQIQQVIETREPLRDQTPFTGPTGETRHYEYIFVPVFGPDGKVQSVTGSTRDVTDRRTAEDELRRVNRELEEFAYVASHDLQEPLRMVNIYTQLILRRVGANDADLNAYAAFVKQGVFRMEGLIRDLLTFSRISHETASPVGAADLEASLAETLSVLGNRIAETGAVIVAQPLPTVRGDAQQMAHVFQNLLSNALKYSKKDVVPQIQIAAQPDGDRWIVSVRDNGIGFDPQYAERIFGLFKRLHRDEYPGTGLGLAICQRIVERYGGRMWAEGRPEEGATFYFMLPKAEQP